MREKYKINEIFYSLQGEGVRAGTANVFVRFSACNLECKLATHGFDCDTDFVSGRFYTGEQLVAAVQELLEKNSTEDVCSSSVIFTGGEPTLQLDEGLIDLFLEQGIYLAIETNGTMPMPYQSSIHWITVSPKPKLSGTPFIGKEAVVIEHCTEVKFVIAFGMPIPGPMHDMPQAKHYLISPAHQLDGTVLVEDMDWCIDLVKQNPSWRLSVQQHKTWGVR